MTTLILAIVLPPLALFVIFALVFLMIEHTHGFFITLGWAAVSFVLYCVFRVNGL